jgi:hypothetical protein
MIKFREHRGSLEESIKTLKEFKTKEELLDFLNKKFKVAIHKINSNPYFQHYDRHADWKETYIITINSGGVLGFTDKPITEPTTEMDNWIIKMNDRAKSIYGVEGNLINYNEFPHVSYGIGEPKIIKLHGDFTIHQLQALINHMKKYNKGV